MFDEIRDEIKSTAEHFKREMPQEIKTLLTLAKSDLHNGPVYLDSDGDECSCFDDGAKRFEFAAACCAISGYLESISDLYHVEFQTCDECNGTGMDDDGNDCAECCAEGCKQYEESLSGTREMIIRQIVGNDLAQYV